MLPSALRQDLEVRRSSSSAILFTVCWPEVLLLEPAKQQVGKYTRRTRNSLQVRA